MQSSVRRRRSFVCSPVSGSAESVLTPSQFHLDLWLSFTVQNLLLHVGRPVVMLVLPPDLVPQNRPGPAELLHLLYNITAPLVLIKMLERGRRALPPALLHLGVTSVAMGTTLHLVSDGVTWRLLLIGYQPHPSVREKPAAMELGLSSLVDVVELVRHYDDAVGHMMWYVPLFLVLLFFFSGCFRRRAGAVTPAGSVTPAGAATPAAACTLLLLPSAASYWFLITEGQTFILFTFTFFAMIATVMQQRGRGLIPDTNGVFMLHSFLLALLLVCVWVFCLWNVEVLWRKHSALIFIPQPRAVYMLHLHQVNSSNWGRG